MSSHALSAVTSGETRVYLKVDLTLIGQRISTEKIQEKAKFVYLEVTELSECILRQCRWASESFLPHHNRR